MPQVSPRSINQWSVEVCTIKRVSSKVRHVTAASCVKCISLTHTLGTGYIVLVGSANHCHLNGATQATTHSCHVVASHLYHTHTRSDNSSYCQPLFPYPELVCP